ncbi:preprotein translocase subunit SecE [Clostridium botulinum C]|uniref:Protein translocase subunit SecE n=4 Tax=Clostridium TaxID=1485 RepID=A0A9Q1ZBC1_CLOBO|nr:MULTISPECIES: preprotein translocase subunit SecE [Clostridium]AEB74894.1 Preprotein translocase secE subunit [Clostridium botulinum BKT015925]AYF53772.1 preprotein translocase subunit SecE [Clostridium novyi]EES91293.1 preprotein translocase, SecE subunit [Clostridium botulinum D str. 1873]KEI01023.1 preprotein translocase subunit SecE [Clostridium botulinum C/D str. Sp77]KEI03717.1 preprotein translocase subunit SecE [Clostridium botulinum D str. 16868]
MALNESKKLEKQSSGGIVKFLKELKAETKRITWPPKEQTKKSTIIVLFFCAVSAIIIGLMDSGFSSLYKIIFK